MWNDNRNFVIISEYCGQGTLADLIGSNLEDLPKYLLGVAKGLEYLHNTMRAVHGSLSLENVAVQDGQALIDRIGL